MAYWKRFVSKLHNFIRPARAEEELAREVAAHLKLLEDEFQRRGMNGLDAQFAARRTYGGVEQAKELHRQERSFLWLEQARQDIRFSARMLIKNRGFTVTTVLTLALGIGVNSAIFSVINAVLLAPLPYRNPDRLVRIIENVPAAESLTGSAFRLTAMSPEDVIELQKQTKTLSHVALYLPSTMVLTGFGEARVVPVGQLSLATFPMLGIRPLLGRQFASGEDKTGADHVVVLSYSAWLRYFARDPNLLGRATTLDNIAYTVVGVMPRKFEFPDAKTDFWKPLVVSAAARGQISVFPVMARLEDDISPSAAAAEVNGIFRRIRGETPLDNNARAGTDRMDVVPVKDAQAAVSRPALLVVAGAAWFVLLIACANVSNLLLARTMSREREIAIRTSLGAGRNRLVRQTIVESVVLALVAGIVGMCFALAANQLLLTHWLGNVKAMQSVPRLDHLAMDGSVLLFTLAISLLAALLFGMPPGHCQLGACASKRVVVSATFSVGLAVQAGHIVPGYKSDFPHGSIANS